MAFAEVLKRCGNELTRENLMAQAASLNNVANSMLFPGLTLSTSASDYHPIEQMQMMRFDGAHWILFGDLLGK